MLMGITLSAKAQNSAEIKGVVKDSISGETLPGANLILLQGTTMITGASADQDGEYYIIGISPGTYKIKACYLRSDI